MDIKITQRTEFVFEDTVEDVHLTLAVQEEDRPKASAKLARVLEEFVRRLPVVVLVVLACARLGSAQTQVGLGYAKWTIDVGAKNLPAHAGPSGGAALDLPEAPGPNPGACGYPHYGYFTRNWSQPLGPGYVKLVLVAHVTGSPIINVEDCDSPGCTTPVQARLYVWQGDPYNTVAGTRWWSSASIQVSDLLSGQPIQILVNRKPGQWSDQYGNSGSSNTTGFYNTVTAPSGIGLTMGSCFYGHGENIYGGSVELEILELSYGN